MRWRFIGMTAPGIALPDDLSQLDGEVVLDR